MAAVQLENIADLVANTLGHLQKGQLSEVAATYQDYPGTNEVFKRRRVTVDSGKNITFRLFYQTSGATQQVKLYQEINPTFGDGMATGTVNWRHTNTNWSWDDRELVANSGAAQIYSEISKRRLDAMVDHTEHIESQIWGDAPGGSDELNTYGVNYWVVVNATTGFNGGAPSGHTTVGGINLTTLGSKYKNYTAQYTSVTKADLITKMRTGFRKILFKNPVRHGSHKKGRDNCVIYAGEAEVQGFEDLGEAQNENLGRDLASMDGKMMFRNCEIVWVPRIDSRSQSPVYLINWAWFRTYVLKGFFQKEHAPIMMQGNPNVHTVHVDSSWNMVCTNRRAQAVFATA